MVCRAEVEYWGWWGRGEEPHDVVGETEDCPDRVKGKEGLLEGEVEGDWAVWGGWARRVRRRAWARRWWRVGWGHEGRRRRGRRDVGSCWWVRRDFGGEGVCGGRGSGGMRWFLRNPAEVVSREEIYL